MDSQHHGQNLQVLWQSHAPNLQMYLQEQQPPTANPQGTRPQNIMHTYPMINWIVHIQTTEIPITLAI